MLLHTIAISTIVCLVECGRTWVVCTGPLSQPPSNTFRSPNTKCKPGFIIKHQRLTSGLCSQIPKYSVKALPEKWSCKSPWFWSVMLWCPTHTLFRVQPLSILYFIQKARWYQSVLCFGLPLSSSHPVFIVSKYQESLLPLSRINTA